MVRRRWAENPFNHEGHEVPRRLLIGIASFPLLVSFFVDQVSFVYLRAFRGYCLLNFKKLHAAEIRGFPPRRESGNRSHRPMPASTAAQPSSLSLPLQ